MFRLSEASSGNGRDTSMASGVSTGMTDSRKKDASDEACDAGSDDQLLERLTDALAESPAAIVLLNLEDLWLERRPHNVPGTSDERPNWRRVAAYGVDELDQAAGAGALIERLRAHRDGVTSPDRPS